MRVFFVLMLALVVAACGGGETESEPAVTDTSIVDPSTSPTDTTMAEGHDTTGTEELAEGSSPTIGDAGRGANEEDGSAAPESRSPRNGATSEGPPPLPARYRLAYVDGEPLPVTIDENPDCRVELVRGEAWIKDDLSFELQASSRTLCEGEQISEDVQAASGTIHRDGDRLRFEATSGEFFATAVGTYTPGGHIEVDRLLFDADAMDVDWRFMR